MEIEHIMAAVKRPQSNGKKESWFESMDKLYGRFEFNLDRFVECYNNMLHLSIDKTPNIVYLKKMRKQTIEPVTIKDNMMKLHYREELDSGYHRRVLE